MDIKGSKRVAIIVAHPDDETLWAGGTILSHPLWECFIICLCRKNDAERAAKFYQALQILGSKGAMGQLDDGPQQEPQDDKVVEMEILDLLPPHHFDLIITHSPLGEYTRHIRHEEIGKAVFNLWYSGRIATLMLWTFAYEDGNKEYFPRAVKNASIYQELKKQLWHRKYSLITETYGFEPESWEAQTTPKTEAFWQFSNSDKVNQLSDTGI